MSASHPAVAQRSFAPLAWRSTGALVVVVVGAIAMDPYAPRRPPLGLADGILTRALILLAAVAVILRRVVNFAGATFTTVFEWSIVAYVVTAG